jgi:YggT family protein
VADILCQLLFFYLVLLMARIILSWFPIQPDSGMASVFGVLYAVTEPVLGPIRRLLPTMGGGGLALDFSPIIVILAITFLRSAICG